MLVQSQLINVSQTLWVVVWFWMVLVRMLCVCVRLSLSLSFLMLPFHVWPGLKLKETEP